MLMKYDGMMFRVFFLLRFCVHYSKKFANHALSEMMLLRGELGSRITFDVGSRVQEYRRTSPPHP